MKVWRLKLVREDTPDIHVYYRADVVPEMIAEGWLKNHPKAIIKTELVGQGDVTYKFVNGPMVYLRSLNNGS